MGLDMYLTGDRYLWRQLDEDKKVDIKDLFPELNSDMDIRKLEVEFGYWRKANAIHRWFVDNVQYGDDDCGHYDVSREQLQELLDEVNTVLEHREKAPDLFPPQSGFFFGSTDIDEGYWQDMTTTKEILERALDDKYKDWSFQYHSSW